VLVARCRLDGGDDLTRDAQFREVTEAGFPIGAVVTHRLVQANETFLDQVVRIAAGQEVRRGLEPDEPVIAADDSIVRIRVSLLCESDQEPILNLRLRLRTCR